MPPTKPNPGFDRSFIGFGEDYEVRYWCNLFGCSITQLRAAVRAVGNDAAAVRAQLKKK